jgi:hypothetical protein
MTAAANASSNAIPHRSRRLEKTPIVRSAARLVRVANAVPTWQAVMPANVIVVACR